MSALKKIYLPEYTYADYVEWEGRWELIDGIPFAMAPSPGFYHQSINTRIISHLIDLLKNCTDCVALMPFDWKISENTVVQPDALVVCKPFTEGAYLSKTPVLIFEILSPSTSKKDLNYKYDIYEREGVKYYIIINPISKKASIYELTNGAYTLVKEVQTEKMDFDLNPCLISFDFSVIW